MLLAAASRDSNPYIWLFVKVGLSTSLRHAEILSARFDGLDARRRRLRVRVKGGRDREQPLSSELTQILDRERETAEDPDGWIFPSPRSASGHIEDMKTAFKRCVIRAGLSPKEVVPHTMRHTAITNLAETGADIPTIQDFSGHPTSAAHQPNLLKDLVVRAVSSDPVSPEFPVKQGKNREFSRFWAF